MRECKICHNPIANRILLAHEMMFGFRDEFGYLECSDCGSLQIAEIPGNLSKYYPEDYYPFAAPTGSRPFLLKSFLKRQLLEHYLGERNLLGLIIARLRGDPDLPKWVRRSGLKADFDILDVGCGAGHRPLGMKRAGFSSVMGADPYIANDMICKNGARLLRRDPCDVTGQFDFIMLHHSLEHMPDPLATLKHLYAILRPERFVVIRIPVAGCFAWRQYGTNWVELDPPRHLVIPSLKGMRLIADQAGFQIADLVFDSIAFQFWGSEQ